MTKNRFLELTEEVRRHADDVTEMYAGMIESSAAVAAPYEFGVLQESIAVEGARSGMMTAARRRIVVGAYYGLFQHEGTDRGIEPNPFLADAVEHWRSDYLRAISLVVG